MPIYEYVCGDCHGRFQKLVRGFHDPEGLACPRCQGVHLRRAISRFAPLKSEEARMEALADPSNFGGLDENDPRSIAQWARRMGKELGEEAGEDWDEMVEQMIEEELGSEGEDGGTGSGKKKEDDLGWA
ncbi:MAG: zinc ribbon domain-containing protein [Chloroflexaceae bacterium]|nr:zinc ribbon domain-containing protein [Chloroflexaceae bacterium]